MYLISKLKTCNFNIIRNFSTSGRLRTIRLTDRPSYPFLTKNASLVEDTGLYNIHLDNRLLLTPLGNVLSTKSLKVADLIKSELESKTNQLTRFRDLPFTMLLSNSLDLSHDSSLEISKNLKESIKTDTALFFHKVQVSESDSREIPDLDSLSDDKLKLLRKFDLEVLQTFFLTPVLDSFSLNFSLPELQTTSTVSETPSQHPNVTSFIDSFIDNLNPFQLISTLTSHSNLKSIVLTLLYLRDLISSSRALRLSRLEETFQTSHWGITDSFRSDESRILSVLDSSLTFFKLNS